MKMNSAAKAVGIGMAIGGTAIAIGSAMKSKSSGKAAKKNTAKAMKSIIGYMMK